MNKIESVLFALALPFSMLLTGCGAGQHSHCKMAASTQHAVRSITVVGQGEAKGKPDIARTSLGVEATAPTVQEAMDQTTTKMKAILDALKKQGIAEKDIKTANFSISMERPYGEPMPVPPPAMEPLAAPAKPGGKATATAAMPQVPARPVPVTIYRVSNTVEVIVRDVPKASAVLQAAIDAGANNVWNVSFGLDDPKSLEADARAKAIADARARAEALAKLEGLKLGSVLEVSEVIGHGSAPPMAMMSAEAKWGGGPSLSPGEVNVGMAIEVVYALEK